MNYKIFSKNELESKILDKFKDLNASDNPDYIFTFGGDGTFLKAARLNMDKANIKYVPFNLGHVGYYTEFEVDELDSVIDQIKNGDYKVKSYSKLDIEVNSCSFNGKTEALNEIAITNPIRTAVIDIYINDELFEHYRGTGLLVSTPSGSTAYNKSLGGSVIDQNLDTIQITEIAPINNRLYKSLNTSLVLSSSSKIKLVIHNEEKTFICVDGKSFCEDSVLEVEIKYSQNKVNVISKGKSQFLNIKNTFLK